MDEIETGFTRIIEKIEALKKDNETLSEKIRKNDAALFSGMAEMAVPVVKNIGLSMLRKGKQDNKGELYETEFFPGKMILLGKTDPVAFRPDDINKKVDDQFCVFSEDGLFFELMYSADGFVVDSYLHPITPGEALTLYGYDVMFMLYRAMRDYLGGQEDLLSALEKTLEFVFQKE
jgi:hypothetical protein